MLIDVNPVVWRTKSPLVQCSFGYVSFELAPFSSFCLFCDIIEVYYYLELYVVHLTAR